MNKFETVKSVCLLVGSLALVGLTACSDERSASTDAAQTETAQPETPAVAQQEEAPTIDYSTQASGAELAFQSLDADQDQMISIAEAEANLGVSSEFGIIDLDKDGAINMHEFMVYAGEDTAAGSEGEMVEENRSE